MEGLFHYICGDFFGCHLLAFLLSFPKRTWLSDCFDGDHSSEDTGLAAGRSQREKKRSYKDFLREEEEIAAQVRNSSKKKLKVNSKHVNQESF